MIRADLTRRYVKKIVAEIRRAFNYLGEYDERIFRDFAKEKLDELYYELSDSPEDSDHVRWETDDGVVEGIPITIGLGGWEESEEIVRHGQIYTQETIQTLELVVNENELQYVLESFDAYEQPGADFDDTEYGEHSYKKVKLEDVDKKVIHRTL